MMSIDRDTVKSILFISLSNLGDIILTTPVYNNLAQNFNNAKLDVLVGETGRALFEGEKSVGEIITFQEHRSLKGRLRQISFIRGKKYDMVVDLKNTFLPLLARTNEPKIIVAADMIKHFYRSLLNRKRVIHKVDEHLMSLDGRIIKVKRNNFLMPVSKSDADFADAVFSKIKGAKAVVINPGAKSHLKRWGTEKFALLSDKLVMELNAAVIVSGNADDLLTVKNFFSEAKEKAENLCGKTTVGSLAEIMRRSSLVITNDSAPLHIASAVNAPTVAIFGPTDDRRYGPLSDRNIVIKGDMAGIEVNEVFNAVKNILNG